MDKLSLAYRLGTLGQNVAADMGDYSLSWSMSTFGFFLVEDTTISAPGNMRNSCSLCL
jgi:hypothetical protein